MRLARGRGIAAADVTGAPRVIVINEAMAKAYWPNADPMGTCLYLGSITECFTVVGIVRDARLFRIRETEVRPQFYLSLAQESFADHPGAMLVRTSGDAEQFAGAVRESLQGLGPGMPFLDVRSLQSALEPEVRPWRLGATVFTLYGIFAVGLAALGLYSATAYAVTMRTREIGVRIAIGARSRDVAGLVLGEGLRVGAVGLALGLGVAALGSGSLATLLYETGPRDATVLAGVGLILLTAVVAASLIPARRATLVDPVAALRAE
jgi:ABC-type antimicrobial peptide transport system permease subunit